MALRLSAKAIGFDRVKAQLRGLPKAIRNRAMRTGFKKIGQLLAKDLKRIIPGRGAVAGTRGRDGKTGRFVSRRISLRSGIMKKSVGHKVKLYRTSGNIMVAVGTRGGFGTEVQRTPNGRPVQYNPARVFHLIDRGSTRITARNYLQQVLARNRARLPPLLFDEVKKVLAKYGNNS
jgi:hypothetical protein